MKLIFIVICCIIIYGMCYYIFPKEISILQTEIDTFNLTSLALRQPIVISDLLQDPNEIIESWFKFNFKYQDYDISNDWMQNRHKYLFINALEDTEIIIYKAEIKKTNPNPDDKIIAIKLKKYQSLILPFKWKYYGINFNKWAIDDLITFSLGRLV
uniref:Uncharacterized protein n=1 Tax=viral metagenome TaxID=1070528 RepID=A0A6C0LKN4_9ZZZZ